MLPPWFNTTIFFRFNKGEECFSSISFSDSFFNIKLTTSYSGSEIPYHLTIITHLLFLLFLYQLELLLSHYQLHLKHNLYLEHQELLKPDNHIYLLDDFGGLTGERLELAESYNRYELFKNDRPQHSKAVI